MTASHRRLIQPLTLTLFVVILLCVSIIAVLQIPQLNQLTNRSAIASSEELQGDVEAAQLRLSLLERIPSFGFKNLIADWTFLNFLQYFGDNEAREKTGYGLSPEYFEVIIGRDPYFLDTYLFLSGSTSLYAGKPERTVALMEQGLQSMSPAFPPQSYYVWRYKGIDELLFLGEADAARQSFETAAEWASTYSDPESENVAAISRQTAQYLAQNPNSRSAQIGAWTMILTNAFDQATRELALERIQALGGTITTAPDGSAQIGLPEEN